MFFILSLLFITQVTAFFATVPEGYVGLYWVLGKLQEKLVTGPTFYIPYYSSITYVKYIQDHDEVREWSDKSLTGVSKEGVTIGFNSVTIANKINIESVVTVVKQYGVNYDKILVVRPVAQNLKELCSGLTVDQIEITEFSKLDNILKEQIQAEVSNLGITVEWVRISGVIVPQEIKQLRIDLATEKGKKKLTDEKIFRTRLEKALEIEMEEKEAEKRQMIANADNSLRLLNSQASLERGRVDNLLIIETAEAKAKSDEFDISNKAKLYSIPGAVNIEIAKQYKDNAKIYFGENIPQYIWTDNGSKKIE